MTRDFEGKNVQDAIEKACRQLNIAADRLNYEVVRKETKKILGFLGGKTALIRVTVEEKQGSDLVKELIDSAFGDHLRKEATAEPVEKEESVAVTVSEEEVEPAAPPAAAPKAPPRETTEPVKKTTGIATIDVEKVKKTLTEILDLMGAPVQSIEVRREHHDCHLVLEEDGDQGMLTGRKGEVLDALQYLMNKLYGVRGGRIYVDCGGFRSRHENNIKKLALKLAAKARKTRKPVTINALNAHDRRIVHLLIQEDKSLYSRSKGDGEYKKIIIYPKSGYRHRDRNRAKAKEVKA
ncbi:MAG: hypothetical protein DRH04_07000 [Deltaproteobacteria bacterium]|nr:MAG: hypothetical protein DRH04_07000 [Deltaproteobacteria bacterium]